MRVKIRTSIKQWLEANFNNWTHGIFVYIPKFYVEFTCDTIEEVNDFLRKLPSGMHFHLTITGLEDKVLIAND